MPDEPTAARPAVPSAILALRVIAFLIGAGTVLAVDEAAAGAVAVGTGGWLTGSRDPATIRERAAALVASAARGAATTTDA